MRYLIIPAYILYTPLDSTYSLPTQSQKSIWQASSYFFFFLEKSQKMQMKYEAIDCGCACWGNQLKIQIFIDTVSHARTHHWQCRTFEILRIRHVNSAHSLPTHKRFVSLRLHPLVSLSLSFAPPHRGVFINVYIICIHDWVLHIKHA